MSFWISKLRQKRSKKILDRSQQSHAGDQRIPLRHILLGILTWLSAVYLLTIGGALQYSELATGQKVPETIVAAVDFTCQDVPGTELRRRQAADSVRRIYSINQGPLDAALRSLDKLTTRIIELRGDEERKLTDEQLRVEVENILDLMGLTWSSEETLNILASGDEKDTTAAVRDALRKVWNSGIASAVDRRDVDDSDEIVLRGAEEESTVTAVSNLRTPREAIEAALSMTKGLHDEQTPAMTKLFSQWLAPNLIYDSTATEESRVAAQRNVKPQEMHIRAGTTLIDRGAVVTPQHVEQLREHAKRLRQLESPYDRFFLLVGRSSLLFLALVVSGGLIKIVQPSLLERDSRLILLFTLSAICLLSAKGFLYLSTSLRIIPPALLAFVIPMGLAPLLTTILLGSGAAVVIGVWTSLAVAILFGNNITILTTGLVATIVAAHASHDVRRRSTVLRAGLWIGLGMVLCVLSFGALYQQAASTIALQAGAALLCGLATALVALLLVQLFEVTFRITTNISLLELSDMGHPLLQRLAMEAPGTYHHSLMVANLAQAATTEIGGNALLVRICAYFHDIGKLTKPEFFTENTQYRDNPHDDLSPSMSTLVIISHVKEGVSLARRHKLPQVIIDGIEQHHGTGLISYFYHRAKKQHQAEKEAGTRTNGRTVNEEDFRYPGPKPASREMGILLLADAVEATSRSMEKPTPNRIESLVHEIVDTRLHDGQLDQCDLTFSDLNTIKRSLIFTLTNMMHGRVPYPKENEDTDKQQAESATDTRSEDQPTDKVVHGASTSA